MNTKRQYYHWILALAAVISVCGICYFCFKPQQKAEPEIVSTVKKEAKVITVFIHGSLYPDKSFLDTISLSDLNTILFDTIADDSDYIKSLKKVRTNPEFYADQIMLAEGFKQIDDNHIAQLCAIIENDVKELPKHGHKGCHHCKTCHAEHTANKPSIPKDTHVAHYAIACYNTLMDRLFPKYETEYYTFGHLGVLSHRYRESVAKALYGELVKKVVEAQDVYEIVRVIIVAHSHGGTIALNLAAAENEFKKGLVIDDLVLFGTPLQHETAPYAEHPMFKRVMNCYSLGDAIQGSDVLTTASRRCYKTFASFEPIIQRPDKVYDVQLVVNDDGHAVNHANMWYMQHQGKGVSHVEPLPYAVMTPALIAALEGHKFGSSVQAMIRSVEGHLGVEVKDIHENEARYASPNAYDIVAKLRDHIPTQTSASLQA
jgi:hypothetical protein